MKATYDKVADAMYLRLKNGKVSRTRKFDNLLLVDMDKKGNILGIEMLDVSSQVSKQSIASAIRTGTIPVAV